MTGLKSPSLDSNQTKVVSSNQGIPYRPSSRTKRFWWPIHSLCDMGSSHCSLCGMTFFKLVICSVLLADRLEPDQDGFLHLFTQHKHLLILMRSAALIYMFRWITLPAPSQDSICVQLCSVYGRSWGQIRPPCVLETPQKPTERARVGGLPTVVTRSRYELFLMQGSGPPRHLQAAFEKNNIATFQSLCTSISSSIRSSPKNRKAFLLHDCCPAAAFNPSHHLTPLQRI